MNIFERAAITAKRKLEIGELCTWSESVVSTDPNKPWIDSVASVQVYSVRMIFKRERNKPGFILSKASDEFVQFFAQMAAQDFVPTVNGIVTRSDGTKLAVRSLNPLAPNGFVIMWEVEFKQ